ncbi:MAG: DUF4244 domain-containing protein [Propionibacteriaceae bacterium]|jgi:hypothetical protein|nr:DUF4244 domain-containing protein [Propionibacteriaceae bacterium]
MVEFDITKRTARKVFPLGTRADAGMTTAEYAVGTVGVVGIGGILTSLFFPDSPINILGPIEEFLLLLFKVIQGIIASITSFGLWA